MCDPVSLTGLAISAVSAGMSYAQADTNADTQAKNIKTAGALQQMDLERQQEQQRQQAASEMNEQARSAQRDAALFDVLAGEYGGGNSVDRGRAVAGVQQGEQLATMAGNARNTLAESSFSSLATTSRTNAQLASIQRPSLFGTALQIGSAAVNTYGSTLRPKAPANGGSTYDYRGTILPNSLRGGQ